MFQPLFDTFHVIFARYNRLIYVYGRETGAFIAYVKIYISYESTRFTATDSHTAVITSEYNMECVKEWLQRQTPIAEMREF